MYRSVLNTAYALIFTATAALLLGLALRAGGWRSTPSGSPVSTLGCPERTIEGDCSRYGLGDLYGVCYTAPELDSQTCRELRHVVGGLRRPDDHPFDTEPRALPPAYVPDPDTEEL